MTNVIRIEHHHNSIRFRCKECKELHPFWPRSDDIGQTITRAYIKCECGILHWKKRLNFRGEGKL